MAPYRGRFAPSPTGLLHMGSLVTALASWLEARAQGGRWLIRMEDLDAPRCVPGAADAILHTLAACGLESDEAVMYQSTRHEAYVAALQQLADAGHCYRCTCSRSEAPGIYNGHCRDLGLQKPGSAWRLRLGTEDIGFHDAMQGDFSIAPATIGDPVIFRRDQVAAYQLAVVVDDAAQGITHVVRGADLLDSTAWQIALARSLGKTVPAYAHVPLVTEPDGSKLAKSRRSLPVNPEKPSQILIDILQLLRQQPPTAMTTAGVRDILDWATINWQPSRLDRAPAVRLQS